MKKFLFIITVLVYGTNAIGQSIINGNFQNLSHKTEQNQLYRIVNYTTLKTDSVAPTLMKKEIIIEGEWYKNL